jgi:tryptophan synthase beta chain
VKKITTETGAGQWGSALSFACNIFDIECEVYMVRVSYEQKPYRKIMMRVWNGKAYPSPSERTAAGRAILEKDPDTPGSLGMAISEAVEMAVKDESTKYSLGSVLNHVLLHQTIVGLEAKEQLRIAEETPDILIGCCGGGSNFAGFTFPFIKDKMNGRELSIIATEPTACPTLTRAPYRYDFGDTAEMTPLLKMHTLGHRFVPPGIHAGGLRYHGMAPLVSLLVDQKLVEARAYHQNPCFESALLFARTEGIIPAPETSHAIKAVIDEAVKCRETNTEKCIAFIFSGHGHFDLSSYEAYLGGELKDFELPEEEILKAQQDVPEVE